MNYTNFLFSTNWHDYNYIIKKKTQKAWSSFQTTTLCPALCERKKKTKTLRIYRLGDWISRVKTKSGAAVTTWTSCPIAIRCRTTWQNNPFSFRSKSIYKKKTKIYDHTIPQSTLEQTPNSIQITIEQQGLRQTLRTSTTRVAWPNPCPVT